MARLAVLAVVVLLAGSACGASGVVTQAVHGGSGVVTADRIGSLQIDVSTQADVLAFAGGPGVNVFGRENWPGVPRYRALAYGCHGATSSGDIFPSPDGCGTVYYINTQTHRLVAFYTESPRFRTADGIRPGMDQNAADRLAHQTPQGPWFAISESSSSDDLILPSSCGQVTAGRCSGKVKDFMLESKHHPIGLTFT